MNILNKIGVAGDWHGNLGWAVIALDQFAAAGVRRILHAGDFGYWPGETGKNYLSAIHASLEQNDQELRVTLGNHEDYVQVAQLVEHPDVPGFVYDPDFPRILVASRGARWEWEGVSFVSLGGAASIDFEARIEGISWWKEERISLGDVYRTVEGGQADVMIAHDSAQGVYLFGSHRENREAWSYRALQYADQSRHMMRQAVNGVKPSIFFHGHYHIYKDEQVTLSDGVNDFSYRNVSLGKDGQANNMAVLSLPDLTVQMLKMPGE